MPAQGESLPRQRPPTDGAAGKDTVTELQEQFTKIAESMHLPHGMMRVDLC
jgi:hypothetical protein